MKYEANSPPPNDVSRCGDFRAIESRANASLRSGDLQSQFQDALHTFSNSPMRAVCSAGSV